MQSDSLWDTFTWSSEAGDARGFVGPGKASTTFKRSSYHQYGNNAQQKKNQTNKRISVHCPNLLLVNSLSPRDQKWNHKLSSWGIKEVKNIEADYILLNIVGSEHSSCCWICYIFNKCVYQHDFLCDVNKIQQSCDTHVNLDNNLSQYHYAKNRGSKNYELEKYPKTHAWRCCNESHCCVCGLKN